MMTSLPPEPRPAGLAANAAVDVSSRHWIRSTWTSLTTLSGTSALTAPGQNEAAPVCCLLTVAENCPSQAPPSRSAEGSLGGSLHCLMTWRLRMTRIDRPAAVVADNDVQISRSCNKQHYGISRAYSKKGVTDNIICKNWRAG